MARNDEEIKQIFNSPVVTIIIKKVLKNYKSFNDNISSKYE